MKWICFLLSYSLVNSEDELENVNSENNLVNISESKGNSKAFFNKNRAK